MDPGNAYAIIATMAYSKIKFIIEQTVASDLIYLNPHANDFRNPDIGPYLDRYLRGSNGYKAEERVKLLKLLWDAWRPSFGGRHELYEINYGARPRKSAAIACSERKCPVMPTAATVSPRNAWPNTNSTAGRCPISPIRASSATTSCAVQSHSANVQEEPWPVPMK
jgi:hypothetical protein